MVGDTPRRDAVKIDPADFADAKEAAQRMPLIMLRATMFAQQKDKEKLMKEFIDLQGNTASGGGFFGMVGMLKPEMIGIVEEEWFRKCSKYSRRVMNSIVGRPLDDVSDFGTQEFEAIQNPVALMSLSQLHTAINDINKAFPARGREVD